MSGNRLSSLAGVERLSRLRVLNCADNRVGSLVAVRDLRDLRALVANDNVISDTACLGALQQLNTLVLSGNALTAINDAAFRSLTALTKLSLSNNQIASLGGALRRCSALAELRVARNRLTALPDELAANTRLKLVDAGGNRIRRLEDVAVLGRLRWLCNVNLRGNPVCDAPGYEAHMIALVPYLRSLDGRPVNVGQSPAQQQRYGDDAGDGGGVAAAGRERERPVPSGPKRKAAAAYDGAVVGVKTSAGKRRWEEGGDAAAEERATVCACALRRARDVSVFALAGAPSRVAPPA